MLLPNGAIEKSQTAIRISFRSLGYKYDCAGDRRVTLASRSCPMTKIRNRWRIIVLESARNDSDGVDITKPQIAWFEKDQWRLCRESLRIEPRSIGARGHTIAVEEKYLTLLAFGGRIEFYSIAWFLCHCPCSAAEIV